MHICKGAFASWVSVPADSIVIGDTSMSNLGQVNLQTFSCCLVLV